MAQIVKRLVPLLIAAFVAATGVVAAAQPAAAHAVTSPYWFNFHETCRVSPCVTSGNLVRLWQNILYTRGLFGSTNDIDGQFGPNTERRTREWQQFYNDYDRFDINPIGPLLAVDGRVGPNTWFAAQRQHATDDDSCQFGYIAFHYRGLDIRRGCSSGAWTFRDLRTGQWMTISHN